jgi:predicted nucleic acid-binding protein
MRKHTPTRAMPRCVLDSGGLTALLGRSQKARAWLRWLALHGGEIIVPAAVLSECTTGDAGRDAEVNRVLGAFAVVVTTESAARLAGAFRFRARTDDGIDALVAAEAAIAQVPTVLLTSDPGDLGRLLSGTKQVNVQRV